MIKNRKKTYFEYIWNMNKGFLPFQDAFGNYFAGEENDFLAVDASTYQAEQQDNDGIVRGDGDEPDPIDVYPIKIRGFFTTSTGGRKSPTSIFYAYNGFAKSSDKTEARCSINYGNLIIIQQDIDSIGSDPFNMGERLAEVQTLMGEYNAQCEAQSAPELEEEVVVETDTMPPLGAPSGGGMPVGGGAPLAGGDMSLYCSQVPDDPACQQGGVNGIFGMKMNWLLIAGVGVAGFLAYKFFGKNKKES